MKAAFDPELTNQRGFERRRPEPRVLRDRKRAFGLAPDKVARIEMNVIRNGATPSGKGPADTFTGSVRIDSRFAAEAPGRAGGAIVTFEPGARTNWHTHPLGQTLIVTAGVGWTQCEGGPKAEIRAGDVIWCPCQRRHWHGATPTTAMTHIAIAEALDGRAVDWMEPVTDEQYLAGPARTD